MKVSEITTSTVANYLRLDDATDTLLTPILSVAKSYISSYTGIHDEKIVDTFYGNGEDVFIASKHPFIASTLIVKIDGVAKTITTDYTVDAINGTITFLSTPYENCEIELSYSIGLDAYDEFFIVVLILCQDMYDNRTYVVDNDKVNVVVKSILDMHCTNLLPTSEV